MSVYQKMSATNYPILPAVPEDGFENKGEWSVQIDDDTIPIPAEFGMLISSIAKDATETAFGISGFFAIYPDKKWCDIKDEDVFHKNYMEIYSKSNYTEPVEGQYFQVASDTWYILTPKNKLYLYVRKYDSDVLLEPIKFGITVFQRIKNSDDPNIDDYTQYMWVADFEKDD